MPKTEFLSLLDELFELDEGTIQESDSLQGIPGWSSLTFVGLIAMADEECEITLAPADVLACNTVHDLIGLLGESIEVRHAA